jgi:hypothetical protein
VLGCEVGLDDVVELFIFSVRSVRAGQSFQGPRHGRRRNEALADSTAELNPGSPNQLPDESPSETVSHSTCRFLSMEHVCNSEDNAIGIFVWDKGDGGI